MLPAVVVMPSPVLALAKTLSKQAPATGIRYPDFIEERRREIAADNPDTYLKDEDNSFDSPDHLRSLFVSESAGVQRLMNRIIDRQPVTDEDILPIADRLNEPIGPSGRTFLGIALARYNTQAIDLLLKNGADPCRPTTGIDGNFIFRLAEREGNWHPRYAAEIAGIYARRGQDPNCRVRGVGVSFTYAMVLKQNEAAWAALMEAGGDPWRRDGIAAPSGAAVVNELSAAGAAARRDYFPYLDYLVANGHFARAKPEDVASVLAEIMAKPSRADERAAHRKRIVRAIAEATGRQDDEHIKRYLTFTLPPVPAAYPVKEPGAGSASGMQPSSWFDKIQAERGPGFARQFAEGGEDLHRLAMAIGTYAPLPEYYASALEGQVNRRFRYGTLLGMATALHNAEAVHFLFRHGADPYMNEAPIGSRDRIYRRGFIRSIAGYDARAFSAEAVALYVLHGFDPNYVVDEEGTTLLGKLVSAENEPAWRILIEAGGNPWARSSSDQNSNIASRSLRLLQNTAFVDYLLERGYFARARAEDVRRVLDELLTWPAANPNEIDTRLRLLKAIHDAAGLAVDDRERAYLSEAEETLKKQSPR